MAYVPVPKDLTKVKTKVALNLTKRQLIFFSIAASSGSPVIPAGKETPWFQCVSDPYGNCHAAIFLYGNV